MAEQIILTADNHLTAKRPRLRTDDWQTTTLDKLEFIFKTARERNACIVDAGDLFDMAVGPIWYLNLVMSVFSMYRDVAFYSVRGNHDEHFHNPNLLRTQFGVLVQAGFITLLEANPIELIPGVLAVGRSWNMPYPEPPKSGTKKTMLVAHATVTENVPPPWLSAQSAVEFIGSHLGYDLIVTGDFHSKFVVESGNCKLVNTGPMLRSSIDKRDFEPAIWAYDGNTVEEILIPVSADVFNLEEAENMKETRQNDIEIQMRMEALAASLDMSDKEKPSFEDIVRRGVEGMSDDQAELKKEIGEIMDYVFN